MELRPPLAAPSASFRAAATRAAHQVNPKASKLLKRLRQEDISNEEALALLPKLLKRKVLRSSKEVAIGILFLSKKALYREAVEFALAACRWRADDQRERAPEPNVALCGAALVAASKSSVGWDLALKVLQHARDATLELDGPAADAAFVAMASAPPDDAGRLMAELRARQEPGILALTRAAAELGRLQQWQLAVDLIISSQRADVTAFEVAVSAAADAGQWPEALALTESMKARLGKASGSALAVAASVVVKAAQGIPLARTLLRSALETGENPHEAALLRLATALRGDLSWRWVLQVLDELQAYAVQAPAILSNTAVGVCASYGLWQQAILILNTMREGHKQRSFPAIVCFNSALSACERAAMPEPAIKLLRDMLECRASPDVTSFARVAGAFGRQTGWEMAVALCLAARKRGLQPDEVLLVSTASSCGATGILKEAELEASSQPWQHAEELLRTACEASTRVGAAAQSSLASSFDKGLEWVRALRTLQVSRARGMSPTVRSFGSVLNSLKGTATWGAALQLLKDIEDAHLETSSIANQAALELFNEGAAPPSRLLDELTTSLAQQAANVITTSTYQLEQHGRFDANSAAILERKVLRGCWARFQRLQGKRTISPGPLADPVLQQQTSLGAGAAAVFSKAALLGCSQLQGRLVARRLHYLEGTFLGTSSGLEAKAIPAWVASKLGLKRQSSSAGRVVGHRSTNMNSDVILPSILAEHDRSQHAERQALLLLLGDSESLEGLAPPTGGIRMYVSAHPCISCTAVFFQLAGCWTGVRLRVAFDMWEETKRWTAPDWQGDKS